MDSVGGSVFGPFEEMSQRFLGFVPSLAAGLVILAAGWLVAWITRRLVARLVLLLRIDRALRGFRWGRGLEKADARHTTANAVGMLAAAVVFLVFLDNAVVVWHLDVIGALIGRIVAFVPRLLVAALVIGVGGVVSAAAAARVRIGLSVEGFARAPLVGRLVQWALTIVAVAVALEVVGLAPRTLHAAFTIGMGTLGLIAALAIGLGSREAVATMWRGILERPEGGD